MSRLIVHPDARLSEKASTVDSFLHVPDIGKKMLAELKHHNGLGLAANQFKMGQECPIGDRVPRIIVLGYGAIYVNPTWERLGKRTEIADEGCLSLPGLILPVRRYKGIVMRAMNEYGEPIEYAFHDFWARVVQHECDHLEGRLISDHIIL